MYNKNERVDYNKPSNPQQKIVSRQQEVAVDDKKPTFAVSVANTAKLNIRVKPTMKAEVSHIVNYEDRLTVEYENSEWAKVLTKSKEGFAMRAFLKEV